MVHRPPLITSSMDISFHAAERLDGFRGLYLRWLLSWAPLRRLYVDRRSRLLTSFIVGGAFSLLLSSAVPLWMLAVGPVLFGLPHLVASFRYSSDLEFRKPFVTAALILSAIVCLIRLAQMKHWVGYGNSNAIEITALALLFLSMTLFFKARADRWRIFAILVPLFVLSWTFPFPTIGALILIHNLVAFFYWYRAARTTADRQVVSVSLAVFILANLAIFGGIFDSFFFYFSTTGESSLLGMKVWEIGSLVLPGTIQYEWLARATVAYAFGQSIHYFIWLRVIPEQSLKNGTPTSFRQSLFYLRRDLGPRLAKFSILLVIALSSVWALNEFSWARIVYLSVAAFHGYSEFVGLCLKGQTA